MRDKLAVVFEMLGAVCVAGGLFLWSPAVSLIWVGAITMIFAWSVSAKEPMDANADTEGN
jgi:uncharacterized membrane protein YphA (DoxX/SURF4 family)